MKSKIHFREFALLMALLMSIVSFSIDAVLPALGEVGRVFELKNNNQTQWVIIGIFSGMTIGQLIAGPLSDAIGRKRILFTGIIIYFLGSLLCFTTQSFEWFLVGRFIQGIGVSGPYVASISIVRDKYSGAQMARIMSLIMMVFMVAPAIAPSLGQLIIHFFGWRDIFVLYMIYATVVGAWVALRLEETLLPENRLPMRLQAFQEGFKEVVSNKTTMSYLLCAGFCFGGFIGYLGTSQQIFMQQFGKTGQEFSAYFAVLAGVMGIASFTNSKIVMKFGMRPICIYGFLSLCLISLIFLGIQLIGVTVAFWMFMLYACILFLLFGTLFGNLNAIAMEPMGHVAGMASAIIGAASSVLSLILASIIGQLYNGTLIPMTCGFVILCGLAFMMTVYENRYLKKSNV
ncbi:multidrug effflux MFS transporter [Acinetobacter baumannii]|jgi:DHA1 family bicyclomycin/chloramphenicol resistance-like MFS transporter|uniref:Bcr/CflA family efflux transporter n=6 Tax=Acinetobacter baumannii TaxID=470 RepID=A0AAV3JXZ1_ACIBA|nr:MULTISPECIES: multidrug effflux MFS transporter [Acinetobacter]AVI32913.1 drug resistance transporter, Bcr/CflA subfamily protein [Acinetobacter baumannii]AVI36104.1 drug resistance transporter, Bcr/CflA subfamily protein [Acinetobacter baumannii]EHU1237546.1 multidrug effflux MFS transporter [Acinetobacter baumannii]EHU1305128.1 multidrug effflux MFS transporter [Acinetobacter baumannii]EHU1427799.1 multidrug effflux MFS transporter [Acinetobacter baumannii]